MVRPKTGARKKTAGTKQFVIYENNSVLISGYYFCNVRILLAVRILLCSSSITGNRILTPIIPV
jgi:hypothetical protein